MVSSILNYYNLTICYRELVNHYIEIKPTILDPKRHLSNLNLLRRQKLLDPIRHVTLLLLRVATVHKNKLENPSP